MRVLVVVLLMLVVYQAPVPSYLMHRAFACNSEAMWFKFNEALLKDNRRELQMAHLSQRCVEMEPAKLQVIEKNDQFVRVVGRAQRKLYLHVSQVTE